MRARDVDVDDVLVRVSARPCVPGDEGEEDDDAMRARAPPLDALELTRATRCARASNFVYKGDDVERFMAMDGFTLRARGVTGATGWAVCDDIASANASSSWRRRGVESTGHG